MTDDTPISEIDRTYRDYLAALALRKDASDWPHTPEGRRFRNAQDEAQKRAEEAFAVLHTAKKARQPWPNRDLGVIGHGFAFEEDSPHSTISKFDTRLLDHPIWLSVGKRYVAAIGQPYLSTAMATEQVQALRDRDLVMCMPPDPLASIHYPGSTLFSSSPGPGRRSASCPTKTAD